LHLIEGSSSPASCVLGMLDYGKEAAKAEERGGRMAWDATQETFYIDTVTCTVEGFKYFVHNVVSCAQEILQNVLFFGVGKVAIELSSLQDSMTQEAPGYFFLDESINRL
jgi:hypothetical protein